jgi:hypothetical protein
MNRDVLAQYLPAHLVELATKFNIPEAFLKEHTDLVVLVLESKSISEDKEKQSWFDLYPLMNDEQVSKLREILTREKEKLQEIEQKYQEKQEAIKRKYEQAVSSPIYQQQQAAMQANEQATKEKEVEEAYSLLDQI